MTPLFAPPAIAPASTLTAAEFMARPENVRAELVRGVVTEAPMPGFEHGKVCLTIGALIYLHAEAHDLGHVTSNDTSVQTERNPDTVRGGDVCFWSYERLPKGSVPRGLAPAAPDLVVEVRSPSDLWTDLFAKVEEYLAAGVRVVVVIDPESRTASVCRPGQSQEMLRQEDALTIPDVLPGFSMPLGKLFA